MGEDDSKKAITTIAAVIILCFALSFLFGNKGDNKTTPSSTETTTSESSIEEDTADYTSEEFEETEETEEPISERYCEDVTSYDRNWNNDMLCHDENGEEFYTSYEGATNFENSSY